MFASIHRYKDIPAAQALDKLVVRNVLKFRDFELHFGTIAARTTHSVVYRHENNTIPKSC